MSEPTEKIFFLDRSLGYVFAMATALVLLLLGSATVFGLVGMYLFHPIIGFFFGLITLIVVAVVVGFKLVYDFDDAGGSNRGRR
jgi:fatty acid desaturase